MMLRIIIIINIIIIVIIILIIISIIIMIISIALPPSISAQASEWALQLFSRMDAAGVQRAPVEIGPLM